jgi:hypothetical protein
MNNPLAIATQMIAHYNAQDDYLLTSVTPAKAGAYSLRGWQDVAGCSLNLSTSVRMGPGLRRGDGLASFRIGRSGCARGHMLADTTAILGALDIVFGECDR